MGVPSLLRTGRAALVPYATRHLSPRNVAWLNDPATVRYSEQRHRSHTLETSRAWVAAMTGGPHYLWAIEETALGLGHVGNLAAYVDPANALADLSILLGEPRARGCGLGLEAWRAGLDWLLGPGGMRKVTAGTLGENLPMLAVMRASGMVPDGTRLRHYLFEGREVDIIHMAAFAVSGPRGQQEGFPQ